ncbi:MAG: translation initiation factor IF-2 [Rickettsiales bacterium]|nr:translation initiation factor IF-2 [Rickettsiales bacterium]
MSDKENKTSVDQDGAVKSNKPRTLSLNKTVKMDEIIGGKTVTVEVRKKRAFKRVDGKMISEEAANRKSYATAETSSSSKVDESKDDELLTDSERDSRMRALREAGERQKKLEILEKEEKERLEQEQKSLSEAKAKEAAEAALEAEENAKKEKLEAEKAENAKASNNTSTEAQPLTTSKDETSKPKPQNKAHKKEAVKPIKESSKIVLSGASQESSYAKKEPSKPAKEYSQKENQNKKSRRDDNNRRRSGKITVIQALSGEQENEKVRSLASIKRAREKARRKELDGNGNQERTVREVIVPEVITVQELSNRMAVRGTDVIRSLMKMGMLVQLHDTIDADTAELIVSEFGHNIKRVLDSDIENVLLAPEEGEELPRAPVVTVMGHVDHGKTSLLDAIRSANIVSGEAGGITQHIGAYRVKVDPESEGYVTFLDTPGHEAFTSMRLRGAHSTDIVVLVVAADDGIMEQTVEAINHARAADVPIIVAINKIDKPEADPNRVINELLQHEIVSESMGGEVMVVEVSAKERTNLDKLIEAIQLQAEILELKATEEGKARGVVVESRVDKGKGVVATVLVQSGTLQKGDILVAGLASGRVRAMGDEHGNNVEEAKPSVPVEILGLDEAPEAGEQLYVVDSERSAKDVIDYRIKRARDLKSASESKGNSLESLFSRASGEGVKELPLIIKSDVHGSSEAIVNSLTKLSNDEVAVKVLHSATGAITESDVTLANASNAMILGFNVRANNAAKMAAESEGVRVRYYSIIYDLVNDIKSMLSNMLEPEIKEKYIGNATVRKVFSIGKQGKVAGCYVTDGIIKRGAGVRLIRDNVVIHEGKLKTLRRFKDDVKEVSSNYECGIAFENYDDTKVDDVIEAFELIEISRTL